MYHTCHFLYHEMRYIYIKGDLSALKSSWKQAGVEPGDQDGPGCVLVLIQMPRFVRDNGTYQTKEWTRGRKPAPKKILVQIHLGISRISLMGWLRLLGSLTLWVSFAKEPCHRDYILQKRPMILRSLLMDILVRIQH